MHSPSRLSILLLEPIVGSFPCHNGQSFADRFRQYASEFNASPSAASYYKSSVDARKVICSLDTSGRYSILYRKESLLGTYPSWQRRSRVSRCAVSQDEQRMSLSIAKTNRQLVLAHCCSI